MVTHLKMFSLYFFASSHVIRLNLNHLCSILVYYYFALTNYFCEVSFDLMVILNMSQKYVIYSISFHLLCFGTLLFFLSRMVVLKCPFPHTKNLILPRLIINKKNYYFPQPITQPVVESTKGITTVTYNFHATFSNTTASENKYLLCVR